MFLNVKRLRPNAKLPSYHHPDDSGLDLSAAETCTIKAGARRRVPTGVGLQPVQELQRPDVSSSRLWACDVRPRSGNSERGIDVILGTIDAGFTGEISAIVVNNTGADITIREGDRIAQLVVVQIARVFVGEVDELEVTTRGANCFGSTGVR